MNKVTLLGRLTKDFELRFIEGSGKAKATTTIAVTRSYDRKNSDFINVVAFGKTAENLVNFTTKGSQIILEGEIRTGSYETETGKKYYTNVLITNFELIETKKQTEERISHNKEEEKNSNIPSDNDFIPVDDGDIPF